MAAGESLESQHIADRVESSLHATSPADAVGSRYADDSGFDLDESLYDFQTEPEQAR